MGVPRCTHGRCYPALMIKLFFWSMLGLGFAMATFGIYFIAYSNAARSWPSVEGQIVSVSIRTHSSIHDGRHSGAHRQRSYFPQIRYRWSVAGRSFEGRRYALGEEHEDYAERSEAQRAAAQFAAGTAVEVFYDPADPASAVLDPSQRSGAYVPLPLGLLMLAVGIAGMKKMGRLRTTRNSPTAHTQFDGPP